MNALIRINLATELTHISYALKDTSLSNLEKNTQKARGNEVVVLLGGKIDNPVQTNTGQGVLKGRTNNVKTAKNTKVSTVFALMEIDQVIASHGATGAENPLYPQELQPRDRSRESSQAWVQKTSNTLDPESLGRSGRADTGAPIIGDDYVVESGNGRTMAIQLAYERGQAEEYKDWLIDEADYFGFTTEQVESYKYPILVRIRTSEVDREKFVVEANQDDKLSMSATERAKSDAKRLDSNLLGLFAPGADGDLLTVSNQKFIHGFLKSLGETEAAQYISTTGKPTQALVTRIKAAMFSKSYNDDRLLEMMADQTKPELQNMLNALGVAAPKFIEAQSVSRGDIQDVSSSIVDGIEQTLDKRVTNAIIDAANTLLSAKQNDQDIAEYVKQQGLFNDLGEGVPELAVFLSKNGRSAKKMGMLFKAMAEYTEKNALNNQNIGLFGDPEPVGITDALNYAVGVISEHYDDKTGDMFDSLDGDQQINMKNPLTRFRLSKELVDKTLQLKTVTEDDPQYELLKTRAEEIVILFGGLIEADNSPFQQAIDDVVNGNLSKGFVSLGTTPKALELVGIPKAKISINKSVIEKVLAQNLGLPQGEHKNIHNLTPEALQQLPQKINNPIAVFKSSSTATVNGYLVLTELKEQDFNTNQQKPVVAALHIKENKKGLEIINVASVYGRSNSQLSNAFTSDLLYLNKEKGQQFLNTVRLQLPRDFTSDANLSRMNIKTDDDLNASIETDAVREQYQKTDKWLKSPNGKDTKLTEKQWLQVRTPSFKHWFGDWETNPKDSSKIIDDNGEPKIMYADKEKGIYEENKEKSAENGIQFSDDKSTSPIENNVSVFLNIRDESEYQSHSLIAVNDFKKIKSATDNIGTFKPNTDNILDSLTDLNHIDEQAHNAQTSPLNDDPEPTKQQKEDNNYRTGDFKLLGLNICIENPEGSIRAGIDQNGDGWSNTLTAHYGYIDGTKGVDGDEIDCFIKPGIDDSFEGNFYIIDQVNEDDELDEHKVIIGADNRAEAKEIYLSNYADDWNGLGRIRAVTQDDFKEMLKTNLMDETSTA